MSMMRGLSSSNSKNVMEYSQASKRTSTSSTSSIQGEVLIHHRLSHPQHPLLRLTSPYMFTCAGCKDYGAGPRFRCEACNYDLHDHCALAPPSINLANSVHHAHHQLLFYTKPGGGLLRSRCGMCGKTIRGWCFRCGTCNFEIHPCCSKLGEEMSFPVHPLHRLALLPGAAAASASASAGTSPASPAAALALVGGGGGGGGGGDCGVCNRKRGGRVYGCHTCAYHIHAVCAKPMVNGLYASGIVKAPDNDKPTVLGTAARLASHVILGFIGGLIEGIGEGIGEALVDNKAKSKPNPNPNPLITTYK